MITPLFRFVTIASFMFINFFGIASIDLQTSMFDRLKGVNAQWDNYPDLVPVITIDFDRDTDLIQYHLKQVVSNLRLRTSDSWSSMQFKNRLHLLDVLENYAKRKVFPTNLYHATRTPYFIDDFGVHCAVGYLIAQSGNEELAIEISKKFNYNYIEDIESIEMLIWAEKFGFTLDELKWIQPGYSPVQTLNPLGDGTNGKVEKVYSDNLADRLIFVGDFDSVDLQPCLNIGVYQNDQLACLGGGIPGIVNDVYVTGAGVYVVGELESNGTTYPFALYDGTSWSFFTIPGRDGAIGTNTFQWTFTQMEVTIQHASLNGSEEIWMYSAPNTWELEAKVNGVILDIEATLIGRVFAGHFDSVTRYSTIPYTIPVRNVVVKDNWVDDWYGLGSEISDTVKAVEVVGSGIFFGGTCSNASGTSDICLTRYLNGSFQSLVLKEDFVDSVSSSINDIAYLNGSDLILGGDFDYNTGWGTYGTSLASYNLINNSLSGLAVLDNAVNSLVYQNNDLYIGGDFENQFTTQALGHLARITSTIGIEEKALEINAYPNPFQTNIIIEGFDENARYSLLDLSGEILRNNELLLDGNLDLSEFENGIYVLQIQASSGLFTQRIVKSNVE